MFGSECEGEDEKVNLSVIKDLMEQLISEMKPGAEDFEERLGRKKPALEMVKVEAKGSPMEAMEEMAGKDLEGDMEMGEDPEHAAMVMDEGMSPEEKLKKRLMKLRA
jgi:hypothetical protein